MQRMNVVGVVICGVLALLAAAGAMPVTAAAAEPALYECAKTPKLKGAYSGRYDNSTCTEEDTAHTGEYERQEGVGKGKEFKGSGAGLNWEMKGIGGVTCTSSTLSGTWTTPKEGTEVDLVAKGCALGGWTFTSEGAAPGEVRFSPLRARLGYINASEHEVGVDLSPERGPYLTEFDLSELRVRVSGSVIGVLTSPLNAITKVMSLHLAQSAAQQHVRKFEGEPEDTLWSELAKAGTEAFGEALETGWGTEWTTKGEALMVKA